MSETITLKNTLARRTGVASRLLQQALMVVGLVMALGALALLVNKANSTERPASEFIAASLADALENTAPAEDQEAPAEALTPRMQTALDYVTRRYRVSEEALLPVFELAQSAGRQQRIDPLLIVAVIGIESGFNPYAESPLGAQGLMQIIPRYHLDKVPDESSDKSFLNPEVNVRVGAHILKEAIRRRGGLIAGLQYYGGASDAQGSYAHKVLAEKARLEQAVQRRASARALSLG